jgi:hypothetical protein
MISPQKCGLLYLVLPFIYQQWTNNKNGINIFLNMNILNNKEKIENIRDIWIFHCKYSYTIKGKKVWIK